MPRPSRLTAAKNEIVSIFETADRQIYSRTDLATIFSQNRYRWNLPKGASLDDFIAFLAKHTKLQTNKFLAEAYGQQIIRYTWGTVHPLALATSLKPRGYLCHATALSIHGLAPLNTKIIYLNAEQSAKGAVPPTLSQEGIDRAFSGKQRQSKLVFKCGQISVVIVAGKNTNRLAVEETAQDKLPAVSTTNLERTLIDIIVRPSYAGGASELMTAYRKAKNRFSVDNLVNILKHLDYAYPYHQAIGFLMERTGYSNDALTQIKSIGMRYNFYLTHEMRKPRFSEQWRLYYPNDLN